MMKNRKKVWKKRLCIVMAVMLLTVLLSVLQYAVHYIRYPMERPRKISGTGYLIWGDGADGSAEISFLAEGREERYLYRNEWDAVAVTKIFAEGCSILDDRREDEIWVSFPDNTYPGGALQNGNEEDLWEILYTSRNMDVIICGVKDGSAILDSVPQAKSAVLVLPAKNREEAEDAIKKALAGGRDMGLKEWFVKEVFDRLEK